MAVRWRRRLMWVCTSIALIYAVAGTGELQLQCDLGFEYPGYSIVCPGWKDGWPYIDDVAAYKIKETFGYLDTFVPPAVLVLVAWIIGWPLRALFLGLKRKLPSN